MRLIGHQDIIRLFQRAFRRGGMRLDYSNGFHPHPRLRFSPPLALGLESMAEYVDFDLVNSILDVAGHLGNPGRKPPGRDRSFGA